MPPKRVQPSGSDTAHGVTQSFFCGAYFFRDFSNFTEKPTAIVVRGFSDTGRAAWPRIGTPRRCDTRRNTPAELFIRAAVEEFEAVGADPRLTDAVNLLQEAREAVADYIDGVRKRRAVTVVDGDEL